MLGGRRCGRFSGINLAQHLQFATLSLRVKNIAVESALSTGSGEQPSRSLLDGSEIQNH